MSKWRKKLSQRRPILLLISVLLMALATTLAWIAFADWGVQEQAVIEGVGETHQEFPTPTPTPTLSPTASPTVVARADEVVEWLAHLALLECGALKDTSESQACGAGVVFTVLWRTDQAYLSDGTVKGTLEYGQVESYAQQQYPSNITRGCQGPPPHSRACQMPGYLVDWREFVRAFIAGGGPDDYPRAVYYWSVREMAHSVEITVETGSVWFFPAWYVDDFVPACQGDKWTPAEEAAPPMRWPVQPSTGIEVIGTHQNGGHEEGIDLVAQRGEAVTAAMAGVVVNAGFGNQYGYHVIVRSEDGAWQALYAHLAHEPYDLYAGDEVKIGEPLGVVGCTGNCDDDHLHFELRHENLPVDPLYYLCEEQS
jgi:hypothetical protein